jgi:hypothetical protein
MYDSTGTDWGLDLRQQYQNTSQKSLLLKLI